MIAHRKRILPVLVASTLLLLAFFYHSNPDGAYVQWVSSIERLPVKLPANRTLGFGAVVAVSKEGSSRRHALLQAANVTDIDITIPVQPQWTEGDVETFRNGETDDVQRGSILAWMGHHNALRWFLDSGLETALILEDDVDWDIRLRSVQAPLAASAMRSLLPPARPYSPFAKVDDQDAQYWGNHADWDLLYLGHCGDYFIGVTYEGIIPTGKEYTNLDNNGPHKIYRDNTLPAKSDLHPFTRELFNKLGLSDHQRAVHRSRWPLCSFGYAVTRPAAERLLTDLAPPKLKPGRPRAFDVALLHACSEGRKTPSPTDPNNNPHPHPNPKLRNKYASAGLRCWTINSELFHHMPGESQIAQVDESFGEDPPGMPPVDWAGVQQVLSRNETINIDCGFWNGEFAFEDGDSKTLETLRENVGRQGKCLKRGRH
ncbi:glycosyltransferase family 25 protein [Aaosphaeria arxii CBS 175.79]|uniref:Glycosyltransferase family 25 protein n=1 Tax=Aaosphaeria arxii CBS 175.79 TaxID=1450172 RepID=A0A6A5XP84_9PLEO|nr:glycosyltransferase family 25 protein [Aaosphaeria arxii CBS 175.79]KAF2014962.1 glycosyltransferase family 25 protein [Aaosphaeria arxii CBS 175.79]